MNKKDTEIFNIISPKYIEKLNSIENSEFKFVHYTSADVAVSILNKREVWLRNARCMNDYLEVSHGHDCLLDVFKNDAFYETYKMILEGVTPGVFEEFIRQYDEWSDNFKTSTYITCISEHPEEENNLGRLSMWRAYGGTNPVAIVLNPKPFTEPSNIQLTSSPVSYFNREDIKTELNRLSDAILANGKILKKLTKDELVEFLFTKFKDLAICSKHKGFLEEKEWRVVYNPDLHKSKYINSEIVSINNVPQEVYKIPLKDIPKVDYKGASILELIDRIIIGPCANQGILYKTFEKVLKDNGFKDPRKMIFYSEIPLR